jgi:hypothetical protein
MDRGISIASVVAFALSLAAPASGQPSSWLTASVDDGIDRPLEGVTIAIRGPTSAVGDTSADRRFSFEHLAHTGLAPSVTFSPNTGFFQRKNL